MRRPKVITLLGSAALPGTYLFLYKQAHCFILAAWLICLTTIAAAYKIGLPIIIADAYGDPQLVYPIHKTIIAVITAAVVTGASRVAYAFLVYMLSPLPRRSGWAYGFRSVTQPCQPSPKGSSGRPTHRPFRGLLGVHSRYGLYTRAVTNS